MSEELRIVSYDPKWPEEFKAEARRIREALGSLALRIDHNGSTSIPGLAAKPIIDIQVSIDSLTPIGAYGDSLRTIGYYHLPHPDDSFCPFFHRPSEWPHTHHIHVVKAGGDEERRTLAFRDYLRDHADEARQYEHLKRELAARLRWNNAEARESYARAKTDFIERTVTVALNAGYPHGFGHRS
jgi:GrpB-like predicted nucleotidyltransferase (UPF0157 family)